MLGPVRSQAFRPLLRRGLGRLRQPLGNLCVLPDFLVVGAQKSATTALFEYLVHEPGVRSPIKKEIHYFDTGYRNGLRWYKAHFPFSRSGSRTWITGEASPYYLF